MVFEYNPVAALTQGGLEAFETLKKLRQLKTELYGADSNRFHEDRLRPKLPKGMTLQQLEGRISDIVTSDVLEQMRQEQAALRPMLDESLRQIVRDVVLPTWFPPDAPVMYVVRTEGRNIKEMQWKGGRAGYRTKETGRVVLRVDELRQSWDEVVLRDADIDHAPETFMPEGANFQLSTVHKIYSAIPIGNHQRNGNTSDGVLVLKHSGRTYRSDDSLALHFRQKSGPEKSWKMITIGTGLEERPHDAYQPREQIVDELGIRLLTAYRFGVKYDDLQQALVEMHRQNRNKIDWRGSSNLQALSMGKNGGNDHYGERQKELFLREVPPERIRYYNRIIEVEDRSSIDLSDRNVPPFYLEMLAPIGSPDDIFGRNVVNPLLYPLAVFKGMYNDPRYDPFAYKERDENWRSEHYTEMEWLVGLMLAPALMNDTDRTYVERVINLRMKESGLVKERSYVRVR